MITTEHRLATASVVASLLAALTLSPLVAGYGWFVAVALVVVVQAAVGAAARQWLPWWPAVVPLQILAGVLTLTQLFVRDVAIGGLVPGPLAWATFTDLLRAGLEAAREEAPPVPSSRGLILLVVAGIALVALLVDVIAVSLRKPAVGGLPLLAVYCVPAAVLSDGLSWWWFALGATGYLLLVGADSGDRVHAWGRVLVPGRDGEDRDLGGPLAGARRLTVGCLLAAVVVPAAVPGLGERLLNDPGQGLGDGPGGVIKVINPILNIGENLTKRDDVVVIRYRTNAKSPEPLRIASDDTFDGERWSPSVGAIPRTNRVQNGLPVPPGLTNSAVPQASTRTEIETLDLRQTYLPLPYPASRVNIDGSWLYDPRTFNVVGDQVTTRGLRYTVQHLVVTPTAEQLNAAPSPPPGLIEVYSKLPNNSPQEIITTARQVAGEGTAYEQAVALQEWFRSSGKFTYNEKVLPPQGKDASGQDAVVSFLRNKQGYCVQFASAMAVMARTLNIPARVGVGFLPGSKRADGTWEISIKDAHAWPELYFAGAGWVRFEPTPSTRTGEAPAWAVPTEESEEDAAPSPSASASVPVPSNAPRPGQLTPDTPESARAPFLQRALDAVPWRVIGVLALIAALGAVPLGLTRLLRERRWRRAARGSASARIEAAWDDLRERLDDLGVAWAASWTPRALQLRLAEDHALGGSERAALGRLVADVEQSRYAPPGGEARGVRELRADVDTVVAGVTRSAAVSPQARRRARWVPVTGWRTLTGAARRVDVAADQAGRRVGDLSSSVRRLVDRH